MKQEELKESEMVQLQNIRDLPSDCLTLREKLRVISDLHTNFKEEPLVLSSQDYWNTIKVLSS